MTFSRHSRGASLTTLLIEQGDDAEIFFILIMFNYDTFF